MQMYTSRLMEVRLCIHVLYCTWRSICFSTGSTFLVFIQLSLSLCLSLSLSLSTTHNKQKQFLDRLISLLYFSLSSPLFSSLFLSLLPTFLSLSLSFSLLFLSLSLSLSLSFSSLSLSLSLTHTINKSNSSTD